MFDLDFFCSPVDTLNFEPDLRIREKRVSKAGYHNNNAIKYGDINEFKL